MPQTTKLAPNMMMIPLDVNYECVDDQTSKLRMSWDCYLEFERVVLMIKEMMFSEPYSKFEKEVFVFERRERLGNMTKHFYTRNQYNLKKKEYEKWVHNESLKDVTDITSDDGYPKRTMRVYVDKYLNKHDDDEVTTDKNIESIDRKLEEQHIKKDNEIKNTHEDKESKHQRKMQGKEFCNKTSHVELIKEVIEYKKMMLKINTDLHENNGSLLQVLENYYVDRQNKKMEAKLSPFELEQEGIMLSYKDALLKSSSMLEKQKAIIRSQKIARICDVNMINNLLSQLCIFYDSDISFEKMSTDVKKELDDMISKTFDESYSIHDFDSDDD